MRGVLENCRILVVEDEYLIAEDLRRQLQREGAAVVGPVASVRAALALVAGEPALHAAVLDVNLGGETVYPVADALAARGVFHVFTTGYDAADLSTRYAHVPCFEKPVSVAALARTLGKHNG